MGAGSRRQRPRWLGLRAVPGYCRTLTKKAGAKPTIRGSDSGEAHPLLRRRPVGITNCFDELIQFGYGFDSITRSPRIWPALLAHDRPVARMNGTAHAGVRICASSRGPSSDEGDRSPGVGENSCRLRQMFENNWMDALKRIASRLDSRSRVYATATTAVLRGRFSRVWVPRPGCGRRRSVQPETGTRGMAPHKPRPGRWCGLSPELLA
jgi:hypothetical protein